MYKSMYFLLFNRITDAINALNEGRSSDALLILTCAQTEAEQIFIDAGKDEK